ncbi:hypothetical protein ACJX0J_034503, partial [Zea mays]
LTISISLILFQILEMAQVWLREDGLSSCQCASLWSSINGDLGRPILGEQVWCNGQGLAGSLDGGGLVWYKCHARGVYERMKLFHLRRYITLDTFDIKKDISRVSLRILSSFFILSPIWDIFEGRSNIYNYASLDNTLSVLAYNLASIALFPRTPYLKKPGRRVILVVRMICWLI